MRRHLVCTLLAGLALAGLPASPHAQPRRANILWISAEDLSPDLGAYGDRYAVTPNLDRLASEGVRYTRVFTSAPVCAPSRSALITGMYATSIGTHQMRCQGVPPPEVRCFTEYLRAAGYYCSNNVKTDYQFPAPLTAWDESSGRAHWRGRAPGQPFFAVFNITTTHESQIRSDAPDLLRRLESLKPEERHEPEKAVLPPYYPDTPVVRKDWARYHDLITLMDRQAGEILKQLEEDGLAQDTVVWFWGDHGRGFPRGKRWIYDSGIRAPLIIRVPEKLRQAASPADPAAVRPGSVSEELVQFVDFAPAVLSLAGVTPPPHLQGRSFLGERRDPPREYVYAHRDRMDETYDLIRAVRDRRWKYIRNYMPHLPASQHVDYMDQMPTMREMRRLYAERKLAGPQLQYFRQRKPVEELYDTETDPHEVTNLAGDRRHEAVLARLRAAHLRFMAQTGDVGLIPEPEFDELKRPGGVWEKTASPSGRVSGDPVEARLECATPGASIAYRFGEGQGPWKLYSEPVALQPGQPLRARACRIGFEDSEEVRISADAGAPAGRKAERPSPGSHWRDQLARSDLPDRLRELKKHDGNPRAAPFYLKALDSGHNGVRYWGVVGLHHSGDSSLTRSRTRKAVAACLRDPSPAVRVAAARALCDWGQERSALPVLAEALKHPTDAARLHAAIALEQIGEKARPALPQIRAAQQDPFEYVRRVSARTLGRLGG